MIQHDFNTGAFQQLPEQSISYIWRIFHIKWDQFISSVWNMEVLHNRVHFCEIFQVNGIMLVNIEDKITVTMSKENISNFREYFNKRNKYFLFCDGPIIWAPFTCNTLHYFSRWNIPFVFSLCCNWINTKCQANTLNKLNAFNVNMI